MALLSTSDYRVKGEKCLYSKKEKHPSETGVSNSRVRGRAPDAHRSESRAA